MLFPLHPFMCPIPQAIITFSLEGIWETGFWLTSQQLQRRNQFSLMCLGAASVVQSFFPDEVTEISLPLFSLHLCANRDYTFNHVAQHPKGNEESHWTLYSVLAKKLRCTKCIYGLRASHLISQQTRRSCFLGAAKEAPMHLALPLNPNCCMQSGWAAWSPPGGEMVMLGCHTGSPGRKGNSQRSVSWQAEEIPTATSLRSQKPVLLVRPPSGN